MVLRLHRYPSTTREEVARRVVQQHDAGQNYPERIRGWYNLAGGGSGFLLVETDDPRQLTAFLQPYMDLMSFDVRAAYELEYATRIEELRQVGQAGGRAQPTGGRNAGGGGGGQAGGAGQQNRPRVNPIQVQRFLKGADYPVSKADLVRLAEQEGADENVRTTLEQLPEQQYDGPTAVSEAIGRLE